MGLMTRAALAATLTAGALALTAVAGLGETKLTPVLSTPLKGMEGMEGQVVLIEADPGWETPKHHHPGQLFVYVLEGSLEVAVEGEEPRTIGPGEAVYETPDVPMVGRNASTTEPAKLIVFQVGKAGEPLMVNE